MSASIASSYQPGTSWNFNSEPELSAARTSAQQALPRDNSVTQLVAAWAAQTPDAMALVAGGEAMTYADLDRRANRLANYLIALGVGQEVIVGLCLDRSPESVTCALAVLKAGGADLPLD